jgi:predicted secreted acid phosphatase
MSDYHGRVVPLKGSPTKRRPKSPRSPRAARRSPGRAPKKASPPAYTVTLAPDREVPFPAFFVRAAAQEKTSQRWAIARHARKHLAKQLAAGKRGAVVFDIDDTLINGNEAVAGGFEFMVDLYNWASAKPFDVQVVTARPDEDKANVMKMLHKRGLCVAYDHLHMMDTEEYNSGDSEFVKDFKWGKHQDFVRRYGAVLARLGDRLWDVAERQSPDTYLRHVGDRRAYIFADPALHGTWSYKLPGA